MYLEYYLCSIGTPCTVLLVQYTWWILRENCYHHHYCQIIIILTFIVTCTITGIYFQQKKYWFLHPSFSCSVYQVQKEDKSTRNYILRYMSLYLVKKLEMLSCVCKGISYMHTFLNKLPEECCSPWVANLFDYCCCTTNVELAFFSTLLVNIEVFKKSTDFSSFL